MSISALILCLLFAFALGSVPTGYLVVRLQGGLDIRELGSGNIGTTNVYRALGLRWALVVFFGDALKGFIPVLLGRAVYLPAAATAVVGALAVAGHIFSPVLKGKGGKGVATAFGAMLGLAPPVALFSLAAWAGVLIWKRIMSLASLAAAAALPVSVLVFSWSNVNLIYQLGAALVMAGLVGYAHRENIARLRQGEEKPLSRKTGSGPPAPPVGKKPSSRPKP